MTPIEKSRLRVEMRAAIINRIADEFQASGIEYTCGAVVMTFARKRIIPAFEALQVPAWIQVNSTFKFRKIERDVWAEIHRRKMQ